MSRRVLAIGLRLTVSAGLITLLLVVANLGDLWEALKSASLVLLTGALALVFARVVISAYRWQILLTSKNISAPLGTLACFYLVGHFFNMFLPTVLGGDVVRGYELARWSRRAVDSAASVVMERLLGFMALFAICWISLLFGYSALQGTNAVPIVAALSGAFVLLLVILLSRRSMARILSLAGVIRRWNVTDRLRQAYDRFHSFTARKDVLAKAFLMSVLFQLLGIVSTYLISEALGLAVPFAYFLIVMPVIWVIMMVPISVSGLGVREGAFVLFFTQSGVSTEEAILLSLLFFGLTVVVALVGGVVYAWGGYKPKWSEAGKEQIA
jgi:uncharacterized protein (TIRG00374 family)